jgi:leader peptidase (prepilin peptidase)/N-methyltransferase
MLMDARDGLLPDAFTLGGGLMGVLLLAAGTVSLPADAGTVYATTPEKIVLHRLGWIILVTASLLLLRWIYRLVRRREGMGLGDVKMTAMLTAFLGIRLTALAFLAACIVGTMYAAYVAMRGKSFSSNAAWANRRNAVPFGSFLAIGGLVAMVVGNQILAWYMQFLR